MNLHSLRRILENVVLIAWKASNGPHVEHDGDVDVVCDEDQFGRMFQNLVINAQQAIGEGEGKVEIVVNQNPLS